MNSRLMLTALLASLPAAAQPPQPQSITAFCMRDKKKIEWVSKIDPVSRKVTDPFTVQALDDLGAAWTTGTVHDPRWRIVAGWRAVADPRTKTVDVMKPDDLIAVAIEFRTRRPTGDSTLVLCFDKRDSDPEANAAAKQAVSFFWQPACDVDRTTVKDNNGAEVNGFTVKAKEQRPGGTPRFELIHEPTVVNLAHLVPKSDDIAPEPKTNKRTDNSKESKKGEFKTSYYFVTDTAPIVPTDRDYFKYSRDGRLEHTGMRELLSVMGEIGATGTGSVYWLLEKGQKPEHFILAWLPNDEPWRGPVLVSPALGARHWPEVCEVSPLPTSVEPRSGLCSLPEGTWRILQENIGKGHRLTAIGREGLVFETIDSPPVFRIYRHRKTGYDAPVETRGIVQDGPSKWATRAGFNLDYRKTPEVARHLAALAVCSPAVWKKPRSREPNTDFHLKPLFADPELWACPPVTK